MIVDQARGALLQSNFSFLAENTAMIKNNRKKIIAAIIIIAVIVYFSFFRHQTDTSSQTQTTTVQKGNIVAFVSLSGQISSSNSSSITTQATGVVKRTYVKDGDTVKTGQKLAEIDLDLAGRQNSQSAYASYQNAKNSLTSAQNNLRSAETALAVVYDQVKGHDSDETLVQKDTRTKAEVSKDNAYLSVINAQANVTTAWLKYQQVSPTIIAPIAGTISGFSLQQGTVISSTETKIANVQTGGLPSVSVSLTEVDVTSVKLAQKATIIVDSIPDKTFTGKVVSIDTVGSVSSGVISYPAIIVFDTQVDGLLPNMTVTAKIITDRRDNVLIIPSSVIKTTNGQTVVDIVKDGQTSTVDMVTGLSDGTNTEVVSGLAEGDMVVILATSPSSSSRSESGSTQSVFGGGNFMRIGR